MSVLKMVKPTLLLAMVGLALTSLIGYHAIHARSQEQIRLIKAQIAQEQSNQHAQSDVSRLLRQIEEYRKRLPSAPDASWLVREVVALGQEIGVEPTSISEEFPKSVEDFTRLAVTIEFSGTYHQLGLFLDRLENAPAFIHVDGVDISQARGEASGMPIRLQLSTLYVPKPEHAVR